MRTRLTRWDGFRKRADDLVELAGLAAQDAALDKELEGDLTAVEAEVSDLAARPGARSDPSPHDEQPCDRSYRHVGDPEHLRLLQAPENDRVEAQE